MNKTLRIAFSLKNTYRVNTVLYALKQIPLLKRFLPEKLYGVRGFKIFANVLSAVWELLSIFLGKLLYVLLMICLAAESYDGADTAEVFVHIFFVLTVLGAALTTYMFGGSKDRYYALILLRMNAKEYTLTAYFYDIFKYVAGMMTFTVIFGLMCGVPLWLCLLLPFSGAGLKLSVTAWYFRDFEKTLTARYDTAFGKLQWALIALLLTAAYALPLFGAVLPIPAALAAIVGAILWGIFSLRIFFSFPRYYELNRQVIAQSMQQMDALKAATRQQSFQAISADTRIASRRKGFEYLNELFIRRHKKILWKSSVRTALICLAVTLAALLVFFLQPQIRESANRALLMYLPYFVFVMYMVNRGDSFTRALFMNCDHSLLTYSFFKEPKMVLRLFAIRLREITKINLLPAAVIGAGLFALLYASGGVSHPLIYAAVFVSIVCMSVFFSVHYLVIYYLLQPYNAGTEIKSGTYRLIVSATYFACLFFTRIKLPAGPFAAACIVFCMLYCAAACVLVYKFAPRTFRLRT